MNLPVPPPGGPPMGPPQQGAPAMGPPQMGPPPLGAPPVGGMGAPPPPQFPSLDPQTSAGVLSPQMQQDQAAFAQSQMQAAIAGAMMATSQPSPDQLAATGQPLMGAPTSPA
jgi:hypothetical protein